MISGHWHFSSLPNRRRTCPVLEDGADAADPTGKSVHPSILLSSPVRKNILVFRRRKSVYIRPRPAPQEGRCATSRNAERDAVDAGGALDGRGRRGRRSRVVLALRSRR